MAERVYPQRKVTYFNKVCDLLDQADSVLVVGADNVRSSQMQQVRKALRGKGTLLMGKNTVIRKAIRHKMSENPTVAPLLQTVRDNIGFIFVDPSSSLTEVRDIVAANKVESVAKAGAVAPCSVTVPAGPTGMEPTQTAFLQALNIATKINKGQIEIINDVLLIEEGQKVGSSQATLLQKLNMKPFKYGLGIKDCYQSGFIFSAAALDVTEDDIVQKFSAGVANIAAVSLSSGWPTFASVPHSIMNSYKNLLAIALATDFVFEQAKELKDRFENPEAYASAAPVATEAADDKPAEAVVEEEEEEESDDFGGGGLFGDDDDW